MKKRIISLAIAVMFGCSIYTSAITTYAEEACGETDTVSKGTLLYETEVITQKDYDEGFQNYALSAATVDLAVQFVLLYHALFLLYPAKQKSHHLYRM